MFFIDGFVGLVGRLCGLFVIVCVLMVGVVVY